MAPAIEPVEQPVCRKAAMASREQQVEFLSNLQRLLAEGSFVSTYKYALLLSLADLCIEHGRDDDAPLTIPTRLIGEKFSEYYWRQSAPYLPAGGPEAGVLKQNTGEPPRIVKLLNEVRGAYEGSLVNLQHDERVWKQTVMQVAAQVRKMPLWKLQTVDRLQLVASPGQQRQADAGFDERWRQSFDNDVQSTDDLWGHPASRQIVGTLFLRKAQVVAVRSVAQG